MHRRNRSHPTSLSHSRSRVPAFPAPQEPFDLCDLLLRLGAEEARVLSWPGQSGHGCTAALRSQPAMIAGDQLAGGHTGASGLICCERGVGLRSQPAALTRPLSDSPSSQSSRDSCHPAPYYNGTYAGQALSPNVAVGVTPPARDPPYLNADPGGQRVHL